MNHWNWERDSFDMFIKSDLLKVTFTSDSKLTLAKRIFLTSKEGGFV